MNKVLSNRWRRSESASPMMVLIVLFGILWKGKRETKLIKKGGGGAIEKEYRAVDVANNDEVFVGWRRSNGSDWAGMVR